MTNAELIAAAKAETNREVAYQAYINEVTLNGNTRIDNITICAGIYPEQQRHIAAQVDMAFQAGWSAARSRVPQLIAALEAAEAKLAEANAHADRLAEAAGFLNWFRHQGGGGGASEAWGVLGIALAAHEARKGGV